MNTPSKPDSAARAVAALFIAAIAAGYGVGDLWQMTIAAVLLAAVLTWWLGRL